MPSLAACLERNKDRLSESDVALINSIVDEKRGDGMSSTEAAKAAIDEVLEIAYADRAKLVEDLKSDDTLGGHRFKETPAGGLTVYGDPESIRAKLPTGIKGRVSGESLVFTPNHAPRVKGALRGDQVAYSRSGQVLKKLPMKNGKYVGAPAKHNTPHKIPKLRRMLKDLTLEGERGRFWYENSSKEVLRVTGGDVAEAKKLVAVLSIYSPQAKVDTNTTFAIRAWAQYKMGHPIAVKTGSQDAKAQAAMTDVEGFWSGEKTGNFFFNLLREIDPSTEGKQGATIDMWMMRAGQYDHDAPTQSEYAFMENETNRIAQDLGWEPQQVQAAIWVAMKARMENDGVKARTEAISERKGWISFKQVKGKKTRVIHDDANHRNNWLTQAMKHTPTNEDTGQAKFDFADGLMRHIGQVSWEPRTSTKLPYMPGIHEASYEEQLEYFQAVQSALYDEQGRDELAMQLGLLSDEGFEAPGVWEGDVSPSGQRRVVMAPAQAGVMRVKTETLSKEEWVARGKPEGYTEEKLHLKQGTRTQYTREVDRKTEPEWEVAGKPKGYTKVPSLDPAQKQMLDVYSSILGLVLRQDGVGYHRPLPAPSLKRANGVELRIGRPFTAEEAGVYEGAILKLYESRDWDSGGIGLISSPEGMRVVSFNTHEDYKHFHQVAEAAADEIPESGEVGYFTSDGDLSGNDWIKEPSGENYIQTITSSGRSDVLGWARDYLAARIQAVNEEFAERFDWGDPGTIRFSRSDAAGDGRSGAPSYGTGQEGAVSVAGTHYSRERRTELDSSAYGTGKRGAEAARLDRPSANPAAHDRVFFYVDEGSGVDREAGVGAYAHQLQLENLYDWSADHLGFWTQAAEQYTQADDQTNVVERLIIEAGFDGYYAPAAFGKQGVAVLLGTHTVPVEPGTAPAHTTAQATSGNDLATALDNSDLPGGSLLAEHWLKLLADTEFDTPAIRAGLESHIGERVYRSDLANFSTATAKPQQSLSVDEVETLVAQKVEALDLDGALAFDVVASESDLPKAIIKQAEKEGATGSIRAVYHRGTVYIVAPKVNSAAAIEEALLHEASAHYGARRLLGSYLGPAFDLLYRKLGGDIGVEELARRHGIRMDSYFKAARNMPDSDRAVYLTDELLAHLQGQRAYMGLTEKVKAALQEFWGAVRDAVRNLGLMDLAEVSDADLAHLLRSMREVATHDGVMVEDKAVPRFMVEDQKVTNTPAFKKWFGDSKVVDENGEPLVMYHGTEEGGFSEFQWGPSDNPGLFFTKSRSHARSYSGYRADDYAPFTPEEIIDDSGAQEEVGITIEVSYGVVDEDGNSVGEEYIFPTREQLNNEVELDPEEKVAEFYTLYDRDGYENVTDVSKRELLDELGAMSLAPQGATVYDTYLKLENPLVVEWGGRNWDEGSVDGEYFNTNDVASQAKVMGYDGAIIKEVVDSGKHEHWDSETVYVVFDPEQVKSASSNRGTFDPNNPDIRFSVNQDLDEAAAEGTFTAPQEMRYWDRVKTNLLDKYTALVNTQKAIDEEPTNPITEGQDANLAVTLYPGRARAQLDEFHEEDAKPLLDAIANSDHEWETIGQYLHARHASEANRILQQRNPDRPNNDRLSGMSNREAADVLAFHTGDETLALIGQYVDALNQNRVDMLEQGGLLTDTEAEQWRNSYAHYIPLHRKEAGTILPKRGKGFDIRGKESKLRVGSAEREVDHKHVVARLLMQHEFAINRVEKNRVAQAMYNLAQGHPNNDMWVVDQLPKDPFLKKDGTAGFRETPFRNNVMAARFNGEPKYVVFNESNEHATQILRALGNMDQKASGPIVDVLLKVNRFLAAVNTSLSPEFVISNFFRDIQTAGYNLTDTQLADMEGAVLKDVPHALRGLHNALRGDGQHEWAEHFHQFRRAGGMTGWMQSYEDVGSRLKALQATMTFDRTPGLKQIKALFSTIEDYNNIVENGVRLSAFKSAIDAGLSESQAARLAKELTVNFNRKGEWGTVANALYLFYNASIQGSARLLRATLNKKNHRLHKMIAATVVASAALDMLNRLAGGEDDDGESLYDTIPGHVKDRNLIVMDFWGISESRDGVFLKIPLPWGYNVFHIIGQEIGGATSAALGTNPEWEASKGAGRLIGGVLESFNPIQSGSVLQTLSPTVLDPITMVSENKAWHGGPLYPNYNPSQPNYEKFYANARQTSKELAAWLHEATMDPATLKSSIDVSPEWLDMGYDFVTGSVGRVIADTGGMSGKLIRGESWEFKDFPILRKGIGEIGAGYQKTRFYDRYYEVLDIDTALRKAKGTDRYAAMHKGVGDRTRLIPLAKQVRRQIRKLNKQYKVAKAAGKTAEAQRIDDVRLEVMSHYLTQYHDVMYGN